MKCVGCLSENTSKTKDVCDKYEMLRCSDCDLRFWWPLEEPDAEWYRNNQFYIFRNSAPYTLEKPLPNQLRFLRNPLVLAIAKQGAKLLDVGCGTGDLLYFAQKEGFDVTGIDFDANSIQRARQAHGLSQVYVSSLDDFAKRCNGEKFDAVALFDVLEHQSKPREFLLSVSSVLRDGGLVGLTVPHCSADIVLCGGFPPHHWLKWSRESLTKLFEESGFDILTLDEYATYGTCLNVVVHWMYWNMPFLFGVKKKLVMGRADKNKGQLHRGQDRRGAAVFRILSGIWRIALSVPAGLFYLFCKLSQRKHTIFVLARKKTSQTSY